MTCSIGDHDEVNRELSEWGAEHGLDVALAHDGMLIGASEWMRGSQDVQVAVEGRGKKEAGVQ